MDGGGGEKLRMQGLPGSRWSARRESKQAGIYVAWLISNRLYYATNS
jgi:hypothetical protein